MKQIFTCLLLLVTFLASSTDHNPILPQPQRITYGNGQFLIKGLIIGFASKPSAEDRFAAQELAGILSGISLAKIEVKASVVTGTSIIFKRTGDVDPLPVVGEKHGAISRESYIIKVTPKNIIVTAVSSAGLYYAVQTLRQLIKGAGDKATIPEVEIQDWPSLAYRGFMMDMSHMQFPKVEEIKKQLDFLARWKTNQYFFYSEASIELDGYPLLMANARYTKEQIKDIISYAKARHIDVIPNMELYGIESITSRTDFYQTKKFQNNPNGIATVNSSDYTSILNENTLNYFKNFNEKHNISAVAGFTYQDFLTTTLNAGGSAFLSDIPGSNSLATAGIFDNPGTSYIKSTLVSALGRVNYTFNKLYLFTISMRADGSSVYSADNKWGYFPSAAFAWRLSDERFFKNIKFVKNLKLRTSWGKAGSQAISPYSTLNTLIPGSTVFGSSLYTTLAPGTRLAADLKWETTEQVNVGLEFNILKGRIQLTADHYRKTTRDLLNAVQLPRTTGYTNSLRNVGRVSNKGFEFELNSKIFDKGPFTWDLGVNMSFNRSKVLELYGGQDIRAGLLEMIRFTDFANTYRVGEPMGVIYGYKEDGYDKDGFIKYKSDDKVKIGDPNPNFIFGINSNMSFKDFYLTLFLNGSQGNDIVNMSSIAFTVDNTNGQNKLREVFNNHWTPENPNAKYPLPHTGHSYRFSDRYVEDGSYIRLRNIELGYNIPIQRWMKMSTARIYVSGQNLLTFTNYSWVDPDVNSRGGPNSLDQGIDYSTYPSAKGLTAGVRLGF